MQETGTTRYGLAGKPNKEPKQKRVKVMVALQGFAEAPPSQPAGQSVDATGTKYASKRAEYGIRKEAARARQTELLAWLTGVKGSGSWRRVSTPTAFGTFTLEATDDIIALLARAPGVSSVIPTDQAPLTLLTGASTVSST